MFIYPNNSTFVFTVFDDTDEATLKTIKPVYDLLDELGMRTTKSVWPLPQKDHHVYSGGTALDDPDYCSYMKELQAKGFEIGLHNVGTGNYTRKDIENGLSLFKDIFGDYPSIHVNHSANRDNMYWGYKRFSTLLGFFYKVFSNNRTYLGDQKDSPYFWGDLHKRHIKYTRNLTYKSLNLLKYDPFTPFVDPKKSKYSNFYFSSTDTPDVTSFL
ncbi:MAG: DUF2334 domain-containing protein, partial [bacterium]|nr:DUF2334 domain-containing protein [bacterium]